MDRRPELDWIRLFAFGGLILFHLSELYTNFPWAEGTEGQPGLALFHAALHPWRMGLLFTLSGMATAFLAERLTPEDLWSQRSRRLLIPILFGTIFLIPPEVYWVLRAKWDYAESFPIFLGQYFSPSHSLVLHGVRYALPVFLHLWYLANLILYTLLLTALLKWAPGAMRRLEDGFALRAAGPGLIAWPLVFLVLLRTLFYPLAIQNTLTEELYRHTAFFGLFLVGFLVGRRDAVWDAFVRYRWLTLSMAVLGFAVFGYYSLTEGRGDGGLAEARHPVLHLIRPVEVWSAVCAVFGFGRLYLRTGGPVLLYLSRGVLTFYLVHHPVMLLTAALLRPARLDAGPEAVVVLAVVAVICVASYELVRRLGALPAFSSRAAAKAA